MSDSGSQPFSRGLLLAAFAAGLGFAIVVCWRLGSQALVVGSAEGGWTYPYVASFSLESFLLALLAAAAVAALTWIPCHTRLARLALLAAAIAGATLTHAAMRRDAPFGLETIYRSPGANAFHTFAQDVSASDLLARFERSRRQAPLHAQSNMPGKTLLVHALEGITSNTAVLPWLLVILSNLGALLVFGLAREMSGDERVAFFAAILYLFAPGRLYFFPIMNTITPLLALAFLWIIVRWLKGPSTITAALAGVFLFGLVLFEPLPLVIGLLVVALATAAILRGELTVSTFLLQSSVVGAFFALTAVVFYEVTGFHLLNAFRRIGEHAVAFNQSAGRPYGVWVLANLREFMLSAGPAQLVLAVALPAAGWLRSTSTRCWLSRPDTAFTLGLLAVLTVTNLLGINRGEVVRLWIFLACLFHIPAAWACAALGNRWALPALSIVTAIQAAIGITTIGFVVP